MRTELLDKWLKALTSGMYQQGTRKLKRFEDGTMRYCCLGVLLEVAGFKQRACSMERNYEFSRSGVNSWESTMLSESQCEMVGISLKDAEQLASLNDSGADFDAIALKIEELAWQWPYPVEEDNISKCAMYAEERKRVDDKDEAEEMEALDAQL